ncbi:MAG: hypothetical protein M3285_04435 [Actinomycetota bacterium]|nr:hypothetical protein [Actinomycetota bacterium]
MPRTPLPVRIEAGIVGKRIPPVERQRGRAGSRIAKRRRPGTMLIAASH